MENEVFVDVVGYENLYQVSNYGRVYSLISGKFLKPCKERNGYLYISLHKNKKTKKYFVHKIVATAFIENPLQLPQVNHISEDKSDNRIENLEWCSASYNCNYGTRTARIIPKTLAHPNYKATREKCGKAATEKCSKIVLQFTKDGKFINEFPSVREAERQTSIAHSHISSCCRGKLKSAGKYLWRFKEEEVA